MPFGGYEASRGRGLIHRRFTVDDIHAGQKNDQFGRKNEGEGSLSETVSDAIFICLSLRDYQLQ